MPSLSTVYGRLEEDEHPAMVRLRHDAQGQFVPGVGAVPSRIMLLGEAPGESEERAGRPFVGPAGKILNGWLEFAGIDRTHCFVTNAVKYRPQNSKGANRRPWVSEIEVNSKYVAAELILVRPQWIVTLGSTALRSLWVCFHRISPVPAISDVHGRELRGIEMPYHIFPMYHPAAVFHNDSLVDVALEDAQRLGDVLRSTVDDLAGPVS